jgi:hypothetical protein
MAAARQNQPDQSVNKLAAADCLESGAFAPVL